MGAKFTINVNLDTKCKRCGKGGTVNKTGICMACVAKAVKNGEFDHILNKHKPSAPGKG